MKKQILNCCLFVSFVMMGCQPVFVEMDKMSGTSFPPDSVTDASSGSAVTLKKLFKEGKLSLDVKKDGAAILTEATVTRQRLHQLMTANRNAAYAETSKKWSTYLIVTKRFDPNLDVLGIMFDSDIADVDNLPREGFAVFYDAHTDSWTGQRLKDELFLTTAHELGHSFNLHHTDWEGNSFNNGSTIMSYSLTPDVLWKSSNRSIKHLKRASNHPKEYVKPGKGAKPFGTVTMHHCTNHQSTPLESYTCE